MKQEFCTVVIYFYLLSCESHLHYNYTLVHHTDWFKLMQDNLN